MFLSDGNVISLNSVNRIRSSLMVKVIFKNAEWEIPGNITIRELITDLGLTPKRSGCQGRQARDNETRLGSQGEVKLISVISGG